MTAPNPVNERRAIRILPLVSGYRDQDTHEFYITTDYLGVLGVVDDDENPYLDHLELEDFEVVIPTDQICSCHLFDLEAFEHFTTLEAEEAAS